ncbi:hypothetical protein N7504_006331 [Penicillium tannophilum]|nr:hypothetical protein N7504_006331 [Penicillium tannophilum]
MRPFEHLQILGNAEIYEKISVVLKGLEPWLQGNAKVAEADENGIIQIWTDQIDQATLAIRRLIYEGCAQYALIKTTRPAGTPQNLPFAIYTALKVGDAPAVDEVVLSPAQSIWIEKPARLGGGMTFLVVQPIYPTRILLAGQTPTNKTRLESDEAAHDLAWYRSIIRGNRLVYICPSCKKGYQDRANLLEHLNKTTNSEISNKQHQKLSMIRRQGGDWTVFVQGMQDCLGPIPAQSLRDGAGCFEEDFLRQLSYKAHCSGQKCDKSEQRSVESWPGPMKGQASNRKSPLSAEEEF